MSAEYTIEVYTREPTTGVYTRIGEMITYESVSIHKKRNKPNSATLTINVYSPEAKFISPFKNWILIKRNSTPEFFGNIVGYRGNLNQMGGMVTVECADVLYSLMQLYVEGSYVAVSTEASTIATALITLAQAKEYANLGIQSGTIETVGTTNETLYYQSIGDAIINQSDNITGYDFSFTPVLDANGKMDYIRFDLLAAAGTDRFNLPPLEIGESVNDLTFAVDGEVYTTIYALGAGTGEVDTEQATNSYAASIFGRRESVDKYSSIRTEQSLTDIAAKNLNNKQGVKIELGFSLTQDRRPFYGDFGLGDRLRSAINIGSPLLDYQGTVIVDEIILSYYTNRLGEEVSPIITYYKT